MPSTTNKGYSVQATGSNAGTWGDGPTTSLNQGCFEIIDTNMGGVLTKTLGSSPVTLTASEARNAMVRLNGTLTAAVLVTSSNIGFYMVENVTSGAFAVTLTNGVNTITIAQSQRYLLFADGTNGIRIISSVDLSGVPSGNIPVGTIMLFNQTSAPTGWTKLTDQDNKGLRVVSGAVGTGGSVSFTTVFSTTATNSYTLSTTEIPAHTHSLSVSGTTGTESATHTHAVTGTTQTESANHTHSGTTGTESVDHTHTGSGTTSSDGTHDHTYIPPTALTSFNGTGGSIPTAQVGSSAFTSSAGAHTHTYSFTTSGVSATHTHAFTTGGVSANHTHDLSFTSGTESATHTHTVTSTGTSGSTGGDGGHAHGIDLRLQYVDIIRAQKA